MDENGIKTEIRLLIAAADGLEVQWLLDREMDLVTLFNAYLDSAIARWKQYS